MAQVVVEEYVNNLEKMIRKPSRFRTRHFHRGLMIVSGAFSEVRDYISPTTREWLKDAWYDMLGCAGNTELYKEYMKDFVAALKYLPRTFDTEKLSH